MAHDHQELEERVATLSKSLADLQTQQAAAQRSARTQKWALGIGLLFVGTFALGQAVTNAFNFGSSNNVPSKFAYEGTLVIDGAKVTGSYDMKFTVVDASGTEYDFEITSVAVSDGKFAVEIGPLSQAQFDGGDGDDILLKIAVKQNGSYVALGSGQTLTSVPFAAKASKAVGADDFYVSGKVGIGTTPQVQLHLMSRAAVGTEGSGAVSLELVTKDGDTNVLGPPASNSRGWWLGARGNNYSNSTQINDLQFYYWDGSSWRNDFAIDSLTGNVGIGSGNPAEKLDVAGNIQVSGSVTADSVVAPFTTPSYDSGWISSWSFSNNQLVQSHDLGVVPSRVIIRCRLKSAHGGLDAGDVLTLSSMDIAHKNNNVWHGYSIFSNANELKFNMTSGSPYVVMPSDIPTLSETLFEIQFLAWR